ncbi:MAG: NAD(P)-dependent oxidoreductase, partial [SAR324 cluster bacterium]|nr:NAD(P)-dependent oxidoreductase [SAR324 cluster bacterium]
EVVFTSLPGPVEIREAVLGKDGIVDGAHKETIYVDLSTNAPSVARELAAELANKGIPMLDAPVSGGTDGAKAGTVAVMVGGEKDIFDKVKPLFQCIGANIFHVGDHGAGCTVKLINNMLSFINLYAAGEGFLMGIKAGVDPELLLAVIKTSSGQSSSLGKIERAVLAGDYSPTFALDLAHKDLRLALQLGEEMGTPLSMGSLLINHFRQSVAKGHGPQDVAAMLRVMEENMGTDIRFQK